MKIAYKTRPHNSIETETSMNIIPFIYEMLDGELETTALPW